jgi:hypothetical protein
LLVLLTVTGCFEAGPRDPAIVGVIGERENVGDGQWRFVLQSGDTVVIDTDDGERLEGSTGGQAIGDLLLVGTAAGRDWYMGLFATTMRPRVLLTEYDCFSMGVFATEAGEYVVFDNACDCGKQLTSIRDRISSKVASKTRGSPVRYRRRGGPVLSGDGIRPA